MSTGRKWSGRPDRGAPGTVDGEAAGETSTGPPRSTTDNRLLPTRRAQNTETKGQFIMIRRRKKIKRARATSHCSRAVCNASRGFVLISRF